jgi:hypothetical protein
MFWFTFFLSLSGQVEFSRGQVVKVGRRRGAPLDFAGGKSGPGHGRRGDVAGPSGIRKSLAGPCRGVGVVVRLLRLLGVVVVLVVSPMAVSVASVAVSVSFVFIVGVMVVIVPSMAVSVMFSLSVAVSVRRRLVRPKIGRRRCRIGRV